MTPPFDALTPVPDAEAATFVVTPAEGDVGVLVFASPHSGFQRPADMGERGGLSQETLRSAEDVGVDRLVSKGPAGGAPLIVGQVSRAYCDLNRSPLELDPALVEGVAQEGVTAKVAAGFGVVPRKAGDGTPLYDRRMALAEAQGRLERVHAPYHQRLERLMLEARERHGMALLIDWHSMPARATAGRSGRGVDIVLGDRHGSSCRGVNTRSIRALFEAQGWRVGLNAPYAGGYATQAWGRPEEGFQAVQVELNRGLYLNEKTLEPSPDYSRFSRALDRVIAALTAKTWAR